MTLTHSSTAHLNYFSFVSQNLFNNLVNDQRASSCLRHLIIMHFKMELILDKISKILRFFFKKIVRGLT